MNAVTRKALAIKHMEEFFILRMETTGRPTLLGLNFILVQASKDFRLSYKLPEIVQKRIKTLVAEWAKDYYITPTNSSAYRKWVVFLSHRSKHY